MQECILCNATVFGLIVTLGSWTDSKLTRKIIIEYFERFSRASKAI